MIIKCDFSYRNFPQNYHGIVSFKSNNRSNGTVLILKTFMEYVPNKRGDRNTGKKSHKIQTKIKIKLS